MQERRGGREDKRRDRGDHQGSLERPEGPAFRHGVNLLWKWVLIPQSEASRVAGPRTRSSSFKSGRIVTDNIGPVTLALQLLTPCLLGKPPVPLVGPQVPP